MLILFFVFVFVLITIVFNEDIGVFFLHYRFPQGCARCHIGAQDALVTLFLLSAGEVLCTKAGV